MQFQPMDEIRAMRSVSYESVRTFKESNSKTFSTLGGNEGVPVCGLLKSYRNLCVHEISSRAESARRQCYWIVDIHSSHPLKINDRT